MYRWRLYRWKLPFQWKWILEMASLSFGKGTWDMVSGGRVRMVIGGVA